MKLHRPVLDGRWTNKIGSIRHQNNKKRKSKQILDTHMRGINPQSRKRVFHAYKWSSTIIKSFVYRHTSVLKIFCTKVSLVGLAQTGNIVFKQEISLSSIPFTNAVR